MATAKMMRLESRFHVVAEYIEAFNKHDSSKMMTYVGDQLTLERHDKSPDMKTYEKRDGVREYFEKIFENDDQIHLNVEDITGNGNKCILCWKAEWEEKDHQERHLRGVDIFEVEKELIQEELSYVK